MRADDSLKLQLSFFFFFFFFWGGGGGDTFSSGSSDLDRQPRVGLEVEGR